MMEISVCCHLCLVVHCVAGGVVFWRENHEGSNICTAYDGPIESELTCPEGQI